jgi:hypothetical protein
MESPEGYKPTHSLFPHPKVFSCSGIRKDGAGEGEKGASGARGKGGGSREKGGQILDNGRFGTL